MTTTPDASADVSPDASRNATKNPRHRRVVLSVVLLAAFATNLSLTVLSAVTAVIATDFGVAETTAAWVTLGPMVVSALFIPGVGRFADLYGRKRVWLVGMGLTVIGMTSSALAPSLATLIVARLITGIGVAITIPSGLAISTTVYPPEKRGEPVGWFMSTAAVSPSVGLLVGGLLTSVSWRLIFVVQVPIALLAIVLAIVIFDEQRAPTRGSFDYGGALLAAGALVGFTLGIQSAARSGWSDPTTQVAMLLFLTCTPSFILWERRVETPILPFDLLKRDRVVAWAATTRALVNFPYMGSFFILSFLLITALGWPPALATLALLPRPLAMAVTGPLAGRLLNRGARPAVVSTVGTAIVASGIVGLAVLRPPAPADDVLRWAVPFLSAGFLLALVVKGVGLGLVSTATSTIVTQRADDTELGAVSSVLGIIQNVATVVGMSVMLSIVQAAGGPSDPDAYTPAFVTGAAVAALGTGASVMLQRAMHRQPTRLHDPEPVPVAIDA